MNEIISTDEGRLAGEMLGRGGVEYDILAVIAQPDMVGHLLERIGWLPDNSAAHDPQCAPTLPTDEKRQNPFFKAHIRISDSTQGCAEQIYFTLPRYVHSTERNGPWHNLRG